MRLRSVVVMQHPTVEPVSLGEAKAHLAIMPTQTDDDALVQGMIAAGRRLVERRLGLALATQQLRARYDVSAAFNWSRSGGYPGLRLPVSRTLIGIETPIIVDVDDVVISPSTYTVDSDESPTVVRFTTMPTIWDYSTLSVTYWAGPAGPIAPQLRAAILLYVGHLYANREASAPGRVSEVPLAFEALLASESITGAF